MISRMKSVDWETSVSAAGLGFFLLFTCHVLRNEFRLENPNLFTTSRPFFQLWTGMVNGHRHFGFARGLCTATVGTRCAFIHVRKRPRLRPKRTAVWRHGLCPRGSIRRSPDFGKPAAAKSVTFWEDPELLISNKFKNNNDLSSYNAIGIRVAYYALRVRVRYEKKEKPGKRFHTC